MENFFAHSIEGKPPDEWHRLDEHQGTVPDLRTERSGVVESGLSPAKRSVARFASTISEQHFALSVKVRRIKEGINES
ncbi:MAG TPA: hypothetical protein VFG09_05195 [Thermodesulfovibrionales bacterium]|jgi:hypothetical protein|nr:hypothetical protein [Thermodesulfovibrionales bacterium]